MAKSKIFDLKSLDTWDWAFLGAVLIIVFFQLFTLSNLVQIPGPIFGGDLYYHYGHATHIDEGGSVFKSSHYLGEYEHYPWLTHFAIALLSWIVPGISLFKSATVFFPILVTIISGLIIYLMGQRLFDNKTVSFILSLFWMTARIPTLTPTSTAALLMVPLVFLFLYYAKTMKQRMVVGILIGLACVQHLTVFLGCFIAIGLLFLCRIIGKHFKIEKDKLKILKKSKFFQTVKQQIIFFLPVIILGVLVSLLYLWAPLFIYKSQTLNPWQEYVATGVQSFKLSDVFAGLARTFSSWSTWFESLVSLLAILGIYSSFKFKKKGLPFLLLFVGLIGHAHPLITLPLLGTSYGHYSFPTLFYPLARFVFAGLGVYFLHHIVKNSLPKKYSSYVVVGVLTILTLVSFAGVVDDFKANQWTQIGFRLPESSKALFDIADQIKSTSDVNDVFISTHGETAFALNALTGRKVMFMRRTHSNLYTDANKRVADAAVILYGKDPYQSKLLANEYEIKYFYEDFYSSQARQQCLQAWDQLESVPEASYSCMRTTPEYESYLAENGVEFKKVHARMDPASPVAPTFDLLAIKPSDISNFNFTSSYQGNSGGGVAAVVLGVTY